MAFQFQNFQSFIVRVYSPGKVCPTLYQEDKNKIGLTEAIMQLEPGARQVVFKSGRSFVRIEDKHNDEQQSS